MLSVMKFLHDLVLFELGKIGKNVVNVLTLVVLYLFVRQKLNSLSREWSMPISPRHYLCLATHCHFIKSTLKNIFIFLVSFAFFPSALNYPCSAMQFAPTKSVS